jgi:esterase/lipase superfamily enzyme
VRRSRLFWRHLLTFGRVFILVLLPAASVVPVLAQDPNATISVEGTVVDRDSRPVPDARVEISNSLSKQVSADTQTDADGKFMLVDLALVPGQYSIRASHPQYRSAEQALQISLPIRQIEPFKFVLGPPFRVRGPRGPSSRFTIVKLFYATDRQDGTSPRGATYLNVRAGDGKLRLGTCTVSIPERHQVAQIERPSFWKLEFHENPENHVVLQEVHPQSDAAFFEEVSERVAGSDAKDAFIFVHGYNVSFEDAAQRTAQLAYDLGFKGAPILYSWPSKASLFGYSDDEKSVSLTVENLKKFLNELAQRSGAVRIHLIAHSMGNRALLPALEQLEKEKTPKGMAQFREVVLAAPDVDRDAFTQIASQIAQPVNRLTLYVSSSDQALLVSHKLFHTQPRAGELGTQPIIVSGMDTIDVSGVNTDTLGHSYYGDSRPVISDLVQIFKDEKAPRSGLSQASIGPLMYWLLRPLSPRP